MYDKLYKEFVKEIDIALGAFLFWKKIQEWTVSRETLKALNNSPTSWLVIRHSLQVTFFITLHRIFESAKGHASVDQLLIICKDNLEMFSQEHLRERKDPDNNKPDWLEEYISNAYIPEERDIHMLRGELRKRKNTFNKIYSPIRNKLIAHRILNDLSSSHTMFAETNINEIDDILSFLNSLKLSLYNLYENGKKPDLTIHAVDKEFYENDYNKLIEMITSV
jgi:hypothetical protein